MLAIFGWARSGPWDNKPEVPANNTKQNAEVIKQNAKISVQNQDSREEALCVGSCVLKMSSHLKCRRNESDHRSKMLGYNSSRIRLYMCQGKRQFFRKLGLNIVLNLASTI